MHEKAIYDVQHLTVSLIKDCFLYVNAMIHDYDNHLIPWYQSLFMFISVIGKASL